MVLQRAKKSLYNRSQFRTLFLPHRFIKIRPSHQRPVRIEFLTICRIPKFPNLSKIKKVAETCEFDGKEPLFVERTIVISIRVLGWMSLLCHYRPMIVLTLSVHERVDSRFLGLSGSSQNSYWDGYGSFDEQRLSSVKFAPFRNFVGFAQIWIILESGYIWQIARYVISMWNGAVSFLTFRQKSACS